MLETAAKVNRKFIYLKLSKPFPQNPLETMPKTIIQIYEVQNPGEAQKLINLGVDHIGSVIVSEKDWKVRRVKETIELISSTSAKSSLIPLYNSLDSVLRTLDFYQPDIVHFCDALIDGKEQWRQCQELIHMQKEVKKRFPHILIMRSIPISQAGKRNVVPSLHFAKIFEPVSDFFLTDTILANGPDQDAESQPVKGFVGITGQTCNWQTARELVDASRIPVILAGGISPGNVRAAILQVQPTGIDSCTQTNCLDTKGAPIRFKKDIQKVKQIVAAVRKTDKGN